MELPQFPTGRLLSTLNLPSDLVAKLNSAGYETTSDLAVTSEEELRNGQLTSALVCGVSFHGLTLLN